MTDFTRINQPRVDKINAMISVVFKSARSNRTEGDEVNALLDPIRDRLGSTPAPQPVPTPVKPPATLREAPHIQQIAGFVASLPREQLPSYITHLVNRLCEKVEPAA